MSKNNLFSYFLPLIMVFPLLLAPILGFSQSKDYSRAFAEAQSFAQANKTTNYSLLESYPIEITQNDQVNALLFTLFPKGFILISPFDEKTIMGYSFENDFGISDEYQFNIMSGILGQINEGIKKNNTPLIPREVQDINIPPLIHSLFGQVNCVDDNDNPINVANLYTPNHYAPGCVAVSAATLLHYYQWPIKGMGQHTYSDNYGSSKGTYSANFGDTEYDWANIKERYKYKSTTQTEKEAIATLIYHNCVALNMNFEYNGSTSNVNKIPDTGKDYFRFIGKYASATSPIFWKVVDTNLVHQMPVIFAISASNGAGHSIVCDGLKIDSTGQETHHLNMGWWGSSNGWYKIKNSFSVAGYNKIDGGVINYLPVPMAFSPTLDTGNAQISFSWQVSQRILPSAYEIQVKKDAGSWTTISDTLTQTTYTMDLDTTVQIYYFRVRAKLINKWHQDSWSNTTFFDTEALPVYEIGDAAIHIFPNPFSQTLQIELEKPFELQAYSQSGQLVFQQSLAGKSSISTETWPKGIYILKITAQEATQIFKVIKL